MSSSESERDLLLSASIDGALSPDEQHRLDQMLREDPALARRREEMACVSADIRRAFSASRPRLGPEFADRVVAAAVAEARRENLPPTHPLLMADKAVETADSGSGSVRPAVDVSPAQPVAEGRMNSRNWAAAALALAAAVMLALYLGAPPAGPGGMGDQQLAVDDDRTGTATDPTNAGIGTPDAPGEQNSDPTIDVASAEDKQRDREVTAPHPERSVPSDPVGPRIAASDMRDRGDESRQELNSRANAEVPEPAAAEPAPSMPALAAVLVVSVELTPDGRQSLTLHTALRDADIRIGDNSAVSEELVSHLQEARILTESEELSDAKLYFIEAPARKLDRFLSGLMADRDSFTSLGFSILTDPPLVPSGDASEQSNGIARDLVDADGSPLEIDRGAGFVPLPPDTAVSGLLASPGSEADDVPSQLLLLVH